MAKPNFSWSGAENLRLILNRGWHKISVQYAQHKKPIAVTFWNKEKFGVKVRSVMHDVAERFEVGALDFSQTDTPAEGEIFIDFPCRLTKERRVFKLILDQDTVSADSGICFCGTGDDALIIVSGAYPGTLAIKSGGIGLTFEPEYPLTDYSKREFNFYE